MPLSQRTPPAQRHMGQADQLLTAIWKSLINFSPLGTDCCSSVTFPLCPRTAPFFDSLPPMIDQLTASKKKRKKIIRLIKAKATEPRCVCGGKAGCSPNWACACERREIKASSLKLAGSQTKFGEHLCRFSQKTLAKVVRRALFQRSHIV